MPWTVVEFTDTSTVEAVPTAWIYNNNECFWPTMARTKIINEIKNNVSPNTCWPLYGIRIFKDGTYEDYMTARRKAIRAEDTSDLNSDIEPKRKIIKRKIFASSSDSSEEEMASVLPKGPKLSLKPLVLNNNEHLSSQSLTLETKDITPRQLPSDTFKVTNNRDSQSSSSVILQDAETINNDGSHCCCKDVIKKLDIFSNEFSKRIASVKANLFQIREDMQVFRTEKKHTASTVDLHNLFSFPFTQETNLQEFNNYLADPTNFQEAVTCMKSLGGKDTYEFVKRCLTQIMIDTLAMTFAFDGTKEKKTFKTMKVNLLIETASQQQNGSDRKGYETAVRKWLRRAKERSKTTIVKTKST